EDFSALRHEFSQYSSSLTRKPFLVVGTKLDVPGARENWEKLREVMTQNHLEGVALSAVTGEGVTELLDAVTTRLKEWEEDEASPVVSAGVAFAGRKPRRPLYRFHSKYLLRLMEEVDLDRVQGEELLNRRLQESGFWRYFRAMRSESEVEIGERTFIWDGKGLRLRHGSESERMDREK
ncbi:MAG: GTPase ObgE, partial [Candidatus Caldatribacteriaceae bacterium]